VWLGYVSAAAVAALGLSSVPALRRPSTFSVICLAAAAAIVAGVAVHGPRHRAPWFLFAAGVTFLALANMATPGGIAGPPAEPFSLGVVLSLAVAPTIALGLVLLFRSRNSRRDREASIDTLIVTVAAGYLSWVYLMAPVLHDPALGVAAKLSAVAHPVLDLVVLGVTVRLALGGGKRGTAFSLLLLSMSALVVTDTALQYLRLNGGVGSGVLLYESWIVFATALGAAALHPAMRAVDEPSPDRASRLSRRRLLLMTLIAVASPIIGAVHTVGHDEFETPVRLAASLTLFLLCMVRLTNDLHRREARFRSLVQNSSDVVTVLDGDGTVRYLSDSIGRIFGHDPDSLVGSRLTDWLVHPDDGPRVMAAMDRLARQDRSGSDPFETRWRCEDGSWLHMESVLTDLSHDPSVGGIVMNSRDVSERQGFQRELQHWAFHDSLTGLANRALFRDRVEHTLAGLARHPRPLAVLFLDLDDFKVVNDSLGHAAGDRMLIEVAGRLKLCVRTADTVARLGGDEFALLLDDCELTRAIEVADRIISTLEERFSLGGKEVFIEGSIGIAPFGAAPGGAPSVSDVAAPWQAEDLMSQADVAMYMAKSTGTGAYQVFRPDMHRDVVRRMELKADLQGAIEHGEFVLEYQPIMELDSARATGFEALVRWRHPTKGLIPPLDFIPLAEETGLVIPIGRWVLREALTVGRRLQDEYPSDPPLRMSVNLSARQLQHPALIDDVREALSDSWFPATSLILEITESVMMQNVELAVQRLHALKGLGVRLALDDFGTGYSSLNYLRQFPVDILKIDKSFIDGIATEEDQSVLTAAIIHLARAMDLTPVAEGIEDVAQLERLRELNCELGQGFYLGRPLDEDGVRAALRDGLPVST
jgi:diguanylate cyclase (GGDEF)-like protein/PAS domain S-box-containing protein